MRYYTLQISKIKGLLTPPDSVISMDKHILNMSHFRFFSYRTLLTLGLSLGAPSAWCQEAIIENIQNFNSSFIPLIFDPVLIQTIELNETDDSGEPRFDTVELSSLPSSTNASRIALPDNARLDQNLVDASLAQFQESILQYELDGGVYDFRLSELYLSLGNTYDQVGEYQLAIDAYNEALQLSRINDGLFTEDQIPIVEELVDSYLNLGDIASANLNQEYLLYIQQKIYGAGHPIILAELLEYADWNLHASSLSRGYRPNLQSLHFRTQSFNEFNYIQSEKTEDSLAAAAFAYTQALVIQHDLEAQFNENPTSDETLALKASLAFLDEDYDISETELKLAYTYFLQYQFDQNNIAVNSFGEPPTTYFLDSNTKGRAALERRYAYLRDNNNPAIEVIQALLDIADWYLIFERWSSAEDLYTQAFNLMEANGIEKINGLDYPDLPVVIPSFLGSPYSREGNGLTAEETLEYQGYIDISFSLSRFARPVRIRFDSRSEGTTEETERALLDKIRSSTFRLQLKDRTEYSENDFSVRYYYTVQPAPPSTEE